MTSTVERDLRQRGRPVAKCPECGRAFDPSVDYAGHDGAPPRATCSVECRRARHNRRAGDLRRHRREHAAILAAQEAEGAGQLVVPGSIELPPVADPPPIDVPA